MDGAVASAAAAGGRVAARGSEAESVAVVWVK